MHVDRAKDMEETTPCNNDAMEECEKDTQNWLKLS